jgi:hypothetical protein
VEHIADAEAYLREICRILSADGVCVISTPDRTYSQRHNIVNPYHVREYTRAQFLSLMEKYFAQVEFYYQGFSSDYKARVRDYASSIQQGKKKLNRATQFAIDRLFRPLKNWVPRRLVNLCIRQLVGLSYPQPRLADITISNEQMDDSNVFIAACHQPIPSHNALALRLAHMAARSGNV